MLPQTKTEIKKDFLTTRVCIVGNPKVGKTTFASELGDSVLFAATESGHDFLSVYKVDIKSWQDFETMLTELAGKKHAFKTLVVDVVDKLVEFAEDEICKRNKVVYIKDVGFGAGYTATKKLLTGAFEKVSSLGMGVTFITHAKEKEYKQEAMTWTAMGTSLSKSYEESILGMCDLILYAYVNTKNERVIRTKPNKFVLCAGDRSKKLPEVMPLDAKKVIEALKQ